MRGKLRERETTDYIVVVYQNMQGKPYKEVEMDCFRKGYLYPPFHAFIDRNGTIETVRDLAAVGGSDIEGNLTSIHILVDTHTEKLMNKAQRFSLDYLLTFIQGEYPNAEIVKENEICLSDTL